jgi:hypothetical protein
LTWVFWVHGSNKVRFEEGYRKIADAVGLPGRDKPNVNILQLVQTWLCNEAKGKWLMILDNADDGSVFFRSDGEQSIIGNSTYSDTKDNLLSTFLPNSNNGAIVVTTRDRDAAFRFTGRNQDIIRVEPMRKTDALKLLSKQLGDYFEEDIGANLVETLDYIPLAITQASAYICREAPRTSISKYLEKLQRSRRAKENILNHDSGDPWRDASASNSVMTTWQISFEQIHTSRPSAADLLSLMSFFDRQGIPEDLLRVSKGEDPSRHNVEDDNESSHSMDLEDSVSDSFDQDLSILHAYSMISTEVQGGSFEIHRLVQLSTRRWLEKQGQLEK